MTETDHVLAGLLVILSLSLAFQKAPKGPDLRRAFYIAGAVTGVGIGAAVFFFWALGGRPIADLGLHGWWGDVPVAIGAALAWTLLLLLVLLAIARGAFRERLQALYRRYDEYMPRTKRELAASWVTAVAAGAGEEIAYRGFLLWYAAEHFGLAPSVIGTSLLFGLAHGYQSRFGILFATIMGLLLGLAYLGSESLLLVIWLHATYNMGSFTTGLILRAPVRGGSTSG